MNPIDLGLVMIGAILMLTSAYTFKSFKLDRIEAAILLLLYLGYMTMLLIEL
jgi:Ca2+/Na+ antiporter